MSKLQPDNEFKMKNFLIVNRIATMIILIPSIGLSLLWFIFASGCIHSINTCSSFYCKWMCVYGIQRYLMIIQVLICIVAPIFYVISIIFSNQGLNKNKLSKFKKIYLILSFLSIVILFIMFFIY